MDRWSPEDWALASKAMHDATKAIDDSLEQILEDARELGSRGWTVPMHQLPKLTPIVVRMISAEETDAFFEALYSENTGEEFERVAADLLASRETGRWRPLLAQCVDAYRRTDYLLAVPSLLTIFEGALANVWTSHTRETRRGSLSRRFSKQKRISSARRGFRFSLSRTRFSAVRTSRERAPIS